MPAFWSRLPYAGMEALQDYATNAVMENAMQRRLLAIGGLGWFALIITAVWCAGAFAGTHSYSYKSLDAVSATSAVAPVPAALESRETAVSLRDAKIGELLRRGHRLEIEERWGEAIAHYENAIREFPEEESLRRRFDFSRMHYDLRRRYADASFCDALERLTFEQALDIFTEVFLKVQSHYVKEPRWKELLEKGANGFEVALSESVFCARHIPRARREDIDALRRSLRRELGPMVVGNHTQARRAVRQAAGMAQRRLGISPAAVVLEFMCGATNSLDVYSAYLTPDQLAEVYSQIEGDFVGLGIELRMNGGALEIVRVITGSPAQKAGIRDGDRIVAVDGQSVADMTTDEAANLLQGEVDSVCVLDLSADNGRPRRISVGRKHVEVPSVDRVRIVDRDKGIGYLRLTCFQKTTCKDLDNALWELYRKGMRKGLIIDLRGNPGGLLVTSVEAVDRFVDNGVIVSTRGRNVREGYTYSAHAAGTWRVPLVVLIDEDSASAAEIFAGAIRDHRRGTIVGSRSYGKGSVQGIFPLNGCMAGMRLTTAKFYSPNGQAYNLVGVTPDILVRTAAKPLSEHEEFDEAGAMMEGQSAAGTTPVFDASADSDDVHDPVLATAVDFARRMESRQ